MTNIQIPIPIHENESTQKDENIHTDYSNKLTKRVHSIYFSPDRPIQNLMDLGLDTMNCLTCQLNWNLPEGKPAISKDRFNNRLLDLHVKRIHNFVFDKVNIFHNNETNVMCAILGYFSNLDEVKRKYGINHNDDVKIIEKLFCLRGVDFINDLDGIFLIFIYDLNQQKIYIFQDEFGSNLPLYYTFRNNQIILSTNLKEILKQIPPNERKLNLNACRTLLSCEIIPFELTLINDVNKLIAKHFMTINCQNHSFKINALKIKDNKVSKKNAKNNIIGSIKKNTEILVENLEKKQLVSTQSGGFDSNLITAILAKISKNKITTVTIGGKRINEIPVVEKIVTRYSNVVNKSTFLNDDSLDSIPNMVWILEGYVYERGIFLRHPLAKLLKKNEIHSIFLSECADQLLDFNRFSKIIILTKRLRFIIKTNFLGDLLLTYYRKVFSKNNFLCPKIKGVRFSHKLKLEFELDQILKTKRNYS